MSNEHLYTLQLQWKGNLGKGTETYSGYSREYEFTVPGKDPIKGSADPAFRGDPTLYNPEELFLVSLASCHMLWFLHLCASAGLIIDNYVDEPRGYMNTGSNQNGRFTKVILQPRVTVIGESSPQSIQHLHQQAHEKCFIANSCNFPICVEPQD